MTRASIVPVMGVLNSALLCHALKNSLNRVSLVFGAAAAVFYFSSEACAAQWHRDPALSPDGKSIAFRSDGDLYVAPSTGGAARLLRGTAAHEKSPVWTGKQRIAFAADTFGDYDVFVIQASGKGEPNRLSWHAYDETPLGVSPDGEHILVAGYRYDLYTKTMIYPMSPVKGRSGVFTLPLAGGAPTALLAPAVKEADWDSQQERLFFSVKPGQRNDLRKHEQSPATWDIWVMEGDGFRALTSFDGHDTTPRWNASDNRLYYLSERSGSMNVWRMPLTGDGGAEQVTFHERHPVRGLSVSENGMIAYSFRGELYAGTSRFQKLSVTLPKVPAKRAQPLPNDMSAAIEEGVPAANMQESIVVIRGEIYAFDRSSSRHIRLFEAMSGVKSSPSLSADGRQLLVSRDRGDRSDFLITLLPAGNESWIQAGARSTVEVFGATEDIIATASLSPDGRKVVFTTPGAIKVIGVGDARARTLLTREQGLYNTDQKVAWHPAGAHVAIEWTQNHRMISEVAIVRLRDGATVNVSASGFNDVSPAWSSDGRCLYWVSDRDGLRNFQQSVSKDVYRFFLDPEAQAAFERKDAEPLSVAKAKDVDRWLDELDGEIEALRERRVRVTSKSKRVTTMAVSPDETFVASLLQDGDIHLKPTAGGDAYRVAHLAKPGKTYKTYGRFRQAVHIAPDGRSLFLVGEGVAGWVEIESGEVNFLKAENLKDPVRAGERYRWIFENMARHVEVAYYRPEYLREINWPDFVAEYRRFLPTVTDPADFAELMGELLGELNSSHTWFRYERHSPRKEAGSLGVVYDTNHRAAGWKLVEILRGSPLEATARQAQAGDVIVAFNGETIAADTDPARRLAGQEGKGTTLTIKPSSGEPYEARVTPVAIEKEKDLFYQRWSEWRRRETARLSQGRLGYVHMPAMTEDAFRLAVDGILGAFADREGIVLDLRYNSGGWMHEPLLAFLSASYAFDLRAFGTIYGSEPVMRLDKPVSVLVNEANYSNGSELPRLLKEQGLATIVGAPIAGTGLGSFSPPLPYWEFSYGFAHDASLTEEGAYWENETISPDKVVLRDRESERDGRDVQLEEAVKGLIRGIPGSRNSGRRSEHRKGPQYWRYSWRSTKAEAETVAEK